MKETELIELSDMYLQVRDTKQKIEQQLKDINQELELIELDMIEKMTNNEIDSFKRNGVLFSIVSREFESANPETKEELYKQFKARGYENLFTINANTVAGGCQSFRPPCRRRHNAPKDRKDKCTSGQGRIKTTWKQIPHDLTPF